VKAIDMDGNDNIKIGITFPFDFLHLYGGASQRLKADLTALNRLGYKVEVVFPTKDNRPLLAQHGHEFDTVLTTYCNFQGVGFLPARIRLLLDEYGQVLNTFFYQAFRRQFNDLDLLFVHFPFSFWASHFLARGKWPILYVAHNYEYGLMRQSTSNPVVRKIIYCFEKYACIKARKVLCVSEKDRDNIREAYSLPPEKVEVLPNTVDVEYFSQSRILYNRAQERQKLGIRSDAFVLLFSGKMDYRPNLEALKFVLDELVPVLEQSDQNFKLLIVGAQIPQWCTHFNKRIVSFHTDVPDMRLFYSVADAAIVPLNYGSGTRLKILESFAAKLPVISTAIGFEGIDCLDGEHILLAKRSGEDFVEKAKIIINNKKMRETIVDNAFQLVTGKYSIGVASLFLQDLVKKLVVPKSTK
jgi:glycosyltransferase involved in cell wall biosynthesis